MNQSDINPYSVLKAITGSFLAAFLAGNKPPIIVIMILMRISIKAAVNDNCAVILLIPDTLWITEFIGIMRINDINIPSMPEQQPIINVSALNTWEILRLDAPSARSMPISLVLSITDICVIMPIIMHETTREIATFVVTL